MPTIINDMEQGTPQWMELRRGLPTASEFSKVIKADGARSKSRQKYLEDLAYERLTGMPSNPYQSSAMKRGKLMEPESRETFEIATGLEVVEVAFVRSDDGRYGCSPDGLIGDDAGFETKDAIPRIQLDRLKKNKLPSEHFHQVQGCLYVCEREAWHFRSYCRGMRPLNIKVHRDEKFIKALSRELDAFCDELDEFVERCRTA